MYYSTRFTDAKAKVDAIANNRTDMVADFIVKAIHDAGDEVLPFDRDDIENMVQEFFITSPRANWENISDFCTNAVLDFIENGLDLKDDTND